jgi:hypothetical protein
MIRPRTRLLVDVLLLAGFVVAMYPLRTGLRLHEWLTLALIAPALFHLVVNWDFVTKTLARFFAKLKGASRLNLTVDVPLFILTVTVSLSGFMVSRTVRTLLRMSVHPLPIWHLVHSWSAKIVIWVIGTHVVLHWKWIKSYLRIRKKKKKKKTAKGAAAGRRPVPAAAAAATALPMENGQAGE